MDGQVGVFGGKFLPLHSGHVFAILNAAHRCRELHLILFYNTEKEEDKIRNSSFPKYLLFPPVREAVLKNEFKDYENIKIHSVDCSVFLKNNIQNDNVNDFWDYGSTVVRDVIGKEPDVIFSSEEGDVVHFKKSYPNCKIVLINPSREIINISGTKVREQGPMFCWDLLPRTNKILAAKMVVVVVDDDECEFLQGLLKDLSHILSTTTLALVGSRLGEKMKEYILSTRIGADRFFILGTTLSFFNNNREVFNKDALIFKIKIKTTLEKCYENVVDIEEDDNILSVLIPKIKSFRYK